MVSETVSREIYEDSHSLLNEILTDMSTTVKVGLSFKFGSSEPSMSNVTSGNVDFEPEVEKKNMVKDVSEYSRIKVNP